VKVASHRTIQLGAAQLPIPKLLSSERSAIGTGRAPEMDAERVVRPCLPRASFCGDT